MGKRGRPPIPTAILKARGSWRAKIRPGEPEVDEPMIPTPPDWLTDANALECWNRLRPLLGWMRKTDENLFARYSEAWGRYHERLAQMKDAIEIDEIESLDARLAKLNEQMIRMESQIGLTPSARSSIRVDDKPKNKTKIRLIQGQRKKA